MEVIAPFIIPLATAIITALASIVGAWFVFRSRRDEQLDSRIDKFTLRLENRLELAYDELKTLKRDVKNLQRDNTELKRWVADVRRDLSAIHLYLELATTSLGAEDHPRADNYVRDAMRRLEGLLDEAHSMVEDSVPSLDEDEQL